mgnify:CR=1 FL=1
MSFGPRPWLQAHWDWRAACNFMFGGSGAGLVVAASLLQGAAADLAMLAGLALVAAGLAAVWLEIGRKLRALHVFFNPFTSWMTREAFAAVLLFGLGLAGLLPGADWLRWLAAVAALAFVWCQGRILHGAKGIPAWRRGEVVPLAVASGVAEGAAVAFALQPGRAVLALAVFALLARGAAWLRYRGALQNARAEAALLGPGRILLAAGTAAPLAMLAFSPMAPVAAWLAAASALAAGWQFRFALVTRAAFNQGFALPHLPVRGAR